MKRYKLQTKHTVIKSTSIWNIVIPVRQKITIAILCSVLASALSVGVFILLIYLLQELLQQNYNTAFYYLLGILGCVIVSYLFRLKSFDQSHYAAYDLEAILRKNITSHLAVLPRGYLTETGAGSITKIIHDDVRSLHGFVADSTPLFARAYVTPLFTFIALVWFDYRMALISLLILIIGLLFLKFVSHKRDELIAPYNEAKEEINVAVIEYVQAMPVVRVFDDGEKSFKRYEKALIKFRGILTNWYKKNGLKVRVSMLVLNPLPTLVILLSVGGYLYYQDSITIIQLVASLLLGTGMIESIMPYMSLNHVVEKANISSNRILNILEEKALPEVENIFSKEPCDSAITFKDVSFTYPNRTEEALKKVTFNLKPNSFTALVGASGAGKSTVAKLIPRFWDIEQGSICIGGVDIREMTNDSLMNQISYVFQDNFLFADTIENNIRLGNPSATTEEIIEAAKIAQAHDFILQLPEGYQTQAGERGDLLSGGEKQRIAIARAVLQNRPILILDEATSFADTENESKLMAALNNLMSKKTIIMIAHRLKTIQHADTILVFEEGVLKEQGSHEELMSLDNTYKGMWDAYEKTRDWHIKSH